MGRVLLLRRWSRLNWTKVGLKGPHTRRAAAPSPGLNWTKVGLKGTSVPGISR